MTFSKEEPIVVEHELPTVSSSPSVINTAYENTNDDGKVVATPSNVTSLTEAERNRLCSSHSSRHLRHQPTTMLSSTSSSSYENEAVPNSTTDPSPLLETLDNRIDPFSSFSNGERLVLPEWLNRNNYRSKNGWSGHDLVHSIQSPVRILDYYCQYGPGTDICCVQPNSTTSSSSRNTSVSNSCANDCNTTTMVSMENKTTGDMDTTVIPSVSFQPPPRGGTGTILTGYVHFTTYAESHRGYCHGGAACSIMDDVIGWTAFCVTGEVVPWSGYTVQINTQLHRPIPVHSYLYVAGTITSVVRRKVYITAQLYQNVFSETTAASSSNQQHVRVIYATCEGIVVLNKGILYIPETTTTTTPHSDTTE
jgi:acyl-coenzyme A thioesterase PaaI-like protein